MTTDVCQQCGDGIDEASDAFQTEACVLTPDALFIELVATEFGQDVFELDMRFCWCDVVCLGRWMANAIARQAVERRVAA